MNVHVRAVFLREHEHPGVRDKDRVGSHSFKLAEIGGGALKVAVVRENVRGHMDPCALCVRVADSLLHVLRGEIACLRAKTVRLASDIDSVRSEVDRCFQYFKVLCGTK